MFFRGEQHKEGFIKAVNKLERKLEAQDKNIAFAYLYTSINEEEVEYTNNQYEADSFMDYAYSIIQKNNGACSTCNMDKLERIEKKLLVEALKIQWGHVRISIDGSEIFTYES